MLMLMFYINATIFICVASQISYGIQLPTAVGGSPKGATCEISEPQRSGSTWDTSDAMAYHVEAYPTMSRPTKSSLRNSYII